MTAFDRFDPFAGRVSSALEEIAPTNRPAYLDDVLAQTAGTRQRPRWTFPSRWLPAGLNAPLPGRVAGVPARTLVLLAILLLTIAAAVVWVGSQRRVPPPFGVADNGHLAYAVHGDIFLRDDLTAGERLLIGGPGDQRFPFFSPDGTLLAYSVTTDGNEVLMLAAADGSNERVLLPEPLVDAAAVWGPDSRTIAVVTTIHSFPTLLLVHVDGSPPTVLLRPGDDLVPIDVTWRPPMGSELLVRGHEGDGTVDQYRVGLDGTIIQRLHLESPMHFGPQWENTGAVFSPDGLHIAYSQVETDPATGYDHFRVHVVDADGSNDIALPPPADPMVHEAWPQYSPDGKTILVHDWTWSWEGNEGWLSVMPADGSGAARKVGPVIPGGETTGLVKAWSPDGTRVLVRTENTTTAYSIDPIAGTYELIPWTTELPDWQRVARH